MDPPSTTAGGASHSLLTVLAEGGGRTATLSLLHEHVRQMTGGGCSLLLEPHPASGHMQATSGAGALDRSDVPAGFLLALEVSRLRQQEAFQGDMRELLDAFAERLAVTMDLATAVEPLCASATRLFAADRTRGHRAENAASRTRIKPLGPDTCADRPPARTAARARHDRVRRGPHRAG